MAGGRPQPFWKILAALIMSFAQILFAEWIEISISSKFQKKTLSIRMNGLWIWKKLNPKNNYSEGLFSTIVLSRARLVSN